MPERSKLHSFFKKGLLPAVTLNDADSALRVAEALLEGGIDVMEITFRTQATTSSISAIAKHFPEMQIGAGTILKAEQVSSAADAGAEFGLAPGFQQEVIHEALEQNFPFIPGVTTPSEIEQAMGKGFNLLKLFPVNCIGGDRYIGKLEGPYKHTGISFIPMGGINQSNMDSYLNYSSVPAVGGSWLAPKELIGKRQFKQITAIARTSLEIIQELDSAG